MPSTSLIPFAIVLVLGSALQSAAGFAFGMFAIPLLIILGAEAYEAITIISICGFFQTIVGAWTLRKHIVWRDIAAMTLLAGPLIFLGVLVLRRISDSQYITAIGQIFGGIVLLALLVQWIWRIRPRDQLHWIWMTIAMPISGFMTGLSGMGGPPAVIWIMSHTWTNQRTRVTLWAFFCATTPFSWVALYQRFGDGVFDALGVGAMLAPVMLLGIIPGLWLGQRIPKPRLRLVSYVILLAVSLYAIARPMFDAAT